MNPPWRGPPSTTGSSRRPCSRRASSSCCGSVLRLLDDALHVEQVRAVAGQQDEADILRQLVDVAPLDQIWILGDLLVSCTARR